MQDPGQCHGNQGTMTMRGTGTPGHGHRAIVETMLICIVIHFNIAMDSSSASI